MARIYEMEYRPNPNQPGTWLAFITSRRGHEWFSVWSHVPTIEEVERAWNNDKDRFERTPISHNGVA